jgi:hypothetical protein
VATTPTDLFPPQLAPDKGNSNFDLRHRFVSTLVWTPEYFQKSNRGAHLLLDGWMLTPVISIASGFNYSAFAAGNAPGGVSGGINGSRSQGGSNGPTGGSRFPFISRNSFTVRSSKNVDMRLARRFRIKERMSVEVDVEAFNLFNHVNFTAVGQQQMFSISGANLNFTSSFGVPTAAGNTLINSRQMQFGAKFTF